VQKGISKHVMPHCLQIILDNGDVNDSINSISGTVLVLSGRKPISRSFSVRFDMFHRQNVQRLTGLSGQRELYRGWCASPPTYQSSTPTYRSSTALKFFC
jgi:hypothetical protein